MFPSVKHVSLDMVAIVNSKTHHHYSQTPVFLVVQDKHEICSAQQRVKLPLNKLRPEISRSNSASHSPAVDQSRSSRDGLRTVVREDVTQ